MVTVSDRHIGVCLSTQSDLRTQGATAALWGLARERPPADAMSAWASAGPKALDFCTELLRADQDSQVYYCCMSFT
jgi:hypothetical protein